MKYEALKLHKSQKGKIALKVKTPLKTRKDLSLSYTPGVAFVCQEIASKKTNAWIYTSKQNSVAVVTDGTAVLGLGDIGPEAALPVMEGKAILMKEFADIDAFPVCLNTKNVDEIVSIVKAISPTYGAINLEDISAPRCFEIEEKLKKELDIAVFHDDQHGTAIVVLASLINALKIVQKDISKITITISGAGAAGIAVAKLLLQYGAKNIIMVNSKGIIDKSRADLNWAATEIAELTNPTSKKGSLEDAIKGSDVVIGVSAPNIISSNMISTMNKKAIVLALANPIPEIMPEEALKGGAYIIGTGRSDFPNQVNNVLAFPGVLRAALDMRCQITDKMKVSAAIALAAYVKNPSIDKIIPDPLDKKIPKVIADAIKKGV